MSVYIPRRVAERVMSNYTVSSDGCWISNYSTASHGYAQIGWQSRSGQMRGTTAHRAAWVAHTGDQIPAGMTIDHLCKNRTCVNPDHLRMLSNFENGRRTFGRDWAEGTCLNGHSNAHLTSDPWRRTKSGEKREGRRCKKCTQLYWSRANWRRDKQNTDYPDRLLLSTEK